MRKDTTHSPTRLLNRIAAVSVAIALLIAGTSCSRKTDQTREAAPDSMAAMKGMAMDTAKRSTAADTNSITLTTAQIEHGKIQWAPAALGQSAASAVIPGTIIPNENRTARLSAPAEGRVTTVRVQPGDRVGRGQVLKQFPDRTMSAPSPMMNLRRHPFPRRSLNRGEPLVRRNS